MTQEQKEILSRDLCSRLPYGVKVLYENEIFDVEYVSPMYYEIKLDNYETWTLDISEVKPYLFPLSSMTEEQKEEILKRYNYHNSYELCVEITNHSEGYWDNDTSCNLQDYLWLEDWFNKNHFDYRGLIPMGLANDATGLNIY